MTNAGCLQAAASGVTTTKGGVMLSRYRVRIICCALLVLTSCGSSEPTREELAEQVDQLEADKSDLQSKVDALTEQLEDARDKVAKVKSAADDVQAAASRFDGENWRDVVPDVQSASDDLDTAKDDASEAVEEQ